MFGSTKANVTPIYRVINSKRVGRKERPGGSALLLLLDLGIGTTIKVELLLAGMMLFLI